MSEKVKKWYGEILQYLIQNRLLCGIVLLLVAELMVFTWLNTPATDDYRQYVTETRPQYNGLLPFILFENLLASGWLILYGTIPLGLGVMFGSFQIVSGLVSTVKWLLPEVNGMRIFLCTLPHGIFEIPAIVFSVMLAALWSKTVTLTIFRLLTGRPVWTSLRQEFTYLLQAIALVQIPLVTAAAIMEVTASSWVTRLIL